MEKTERQYEMNTFRTMKLGDGYLVTTEQGSWIFLTADDYKTLISRELLGNSKLFRLLEENGIIITRKNLQNIISEYQSRKNYLFQGTSLHIVAPTLKCNYNCIYCQQKDVKPDEKHMDNVTAEKIIDFIFQSPSENITMEFQGGEPLLVFPVIKHAIEYSKKKNHLTFL